MRAGHYAEAYRLLRASPIPSQQDWDELIERQSLDPVANKHWEFLAVALLHKNDNGGPLSDRVATLLRQMIGLFHVRHESANFRLMKLVAECRLSGRLVRSDDLTRIGLGPCGDGALPDGREGTSSQYHAYMLLLLLRWGDRQDPRLHQLHARAFQWLLNIWEDFGDANPIGRGRFQLFGYGAIAAAIELGRDWGLPCPVHYVSHVHERLTPETPDGALSRSWSGPFRDALLHGYNTPDDYRAFTEFWAGDIARLPRSTYSQAITCYPLDASGAMVIADGSGPLCAVFGGVVQGTEDIGRRKELAHAVSRVMRIVRHVENVPPTKHLRETTLTPNCRLISNDHAVALVIESPMDQWWTSPMVWLAEGAPEVETSTTFEVSRWTWSRRNAGQWNGYSFRMAPRTAVSLLVRHGDRR